MKKLPNSKVEFEQLEQTHINLDDNSANINTVTNAVQAKWGPEYVVVTGDGLEVDGCSGRGGRGRGGTRTWGAGCGGGGFVAVCYL